MTTSMATLPVPCDDCGEVHDMPGRWAFVALGLARAHDEVRLYFRCPQCNSIAYNPALDLPFDIFEFFQVIQPPVLGGKKLLERVTYRIGDIGLLVSGGVTNPSVKLETDMGRRFDGAPGADLTCGVCAPEGVLPVNEVNAAIEAVNRTYPP